MTGTSVIPHLNDERVRVQRDHDGMGWELFGRAAYRKRNWKITWIERPFGKGRFELFDVVNDPGETRDLRDTRLKLAKINQEGIDRTPSVLPL